MNIRKLIDEQIAEEWEKIDEVNPAVARALHDKRVKPLREFRERLAKLIEEEKVRTRETATVFSGSTKIIAKDRARLRLLNELMEEETNG